MGGLWSAVTARGRGVLVLATLLLTAGLAARYPVVAALGAGLLLLVVVEIVAVLRSGAVTVRREIHPRVVVRHATCTGVLHLTGSRRRGLVQVDASDLVDGDLVRVALPEVARPRHPVRVEYDVPTLRRGVLPVGPVQVRRSGITGMAARTSAAGDVDEVRVLPRVVPVTAMMPGRRRAAAGGDDSLELGGTDLVGLHEYTMGDDLRRLHWATSARTGRLMVREDSEPAEPHVSVVLDDRAAAYPDPDAFEEAVELVAALCRITVAHGNPLRWRAVSGRTEIVVPGSTTREPRREARDLEWLLAEIQPVPVAAAADLGTRDLDVVTVVTGAGADLRELGLVLGAAPTRVIAVVDPAPLVASEQQAGALVLRGASSTTLATLWDAAAT